MSKPPDDAKPGRRGAGAVKAPAATGLVASLLANKVRLAMVFTMLILLGSGLGWYMTRPEPPSISDLSAEALELIDDRDAVQRRDEARAIALELLERPERDPDFPGVAEFVLGIVAFRDGQDARDAASDPSYQAAIRWLKLAQIQGLKEDRTAEAALALGMSLQQTGSSTAARPLLEEAVVAASYGKEYATTQLIDIYLDLKTPAELDRALELGLELTKQPLSERTLDRAWLQLAQVYMALQRPAEAENCLKEVSERSWTLGTRVFNAQTLMARKEYQAAMKQLEKVASDTGLERDFPRQAAYLMGVCAESDGDFDSAITLYERTAHRYDRSHEATAARIRQASLLRLVGRKEEAMASFRLALKTIRDPRDYRNRWLGIDEFRRLAMSGWNGWIVSHDYPEAIALTRFMTPLFTESQTLELEAKARQLAAVHRDEHLKSASRHEREEKKVELAQLWKEAGVSWKVLAENQKTSLNYPELIWSSTIAFVRGNSFRKALEQLETFLETNPKRLRGQALVLKSRLLIDLDRSAEARLLLKKVIQDFPQDPAVFDAKFTLGQCELELGDFDAAESIWRDILVSQELTPDAFQWQESLFSLGSLLSQRAERDAAGAVAATESDPARSRELQNSAYLRWEESALRLDEYTRRYPESPHRTYARYLVARALTRGVTRFQLQLPDAETENARLELQTMIDKTLEQANQKLQSLRNDLLQQSETEPLDALEARILAGVSFDIGHTFFSMRKFDQAIVAYNGAMNRHPQDPGVFLACLQLAECYDRTRRPFDARSMIQQARIILSGSTEEMFSAGTTSLSRDDWTAWIAWASQVRLVGP